MLSLFDDSWTGAFDWDLSLSNDLVQVAAATVVAVVMAVVAAMEVPFSVPLVRRNLGFDLCRFCQPRLF